MTPEPNTPWRNYGLRWSLTETMLGVFAEEDEMGVGAINSPSFGTALTIAYHRHAYGIPSPWD